MKSTQVTSPTFILCRPRSRSTWLARFLGGYHDVSIYCKQASDFLKYPVIVDTALALYYKEIKENFPESKVYILLRDKEECLRSVEKLGIDPHNGFDLVSDEIDKLKEFLPVIDCNMLDDKQYLKDLYKEISGESCTDEYVREFTCTKIETIPSKFANEVINVLS